MKTIYAIEPLMHQGEAFVPGDAIECDDNDAASIMSAGRGTTDAAKAKQFKAQYKAQQAAAQQAAAADDSGVVTGA